MVISLVVVSRAIVIVRVASADPGSVAVTVTTSGTPVEVIVMEEVIVEVNADPITV